MDLGVRAKKSSLSAVFETVLFETVCGPSPNIPPRITHLTCNPVDLVQMDFEGFGRTVNKKRTRPHRRAWLGCRQCGFTRWGFKQIQGYLRKKWRFSNVFWISQVLFRPPERGEKGRNRSKRPVSTDFKEERPETP